MDQFFLTPTFYFSKNAFLFLLVCFSFRAQANPEAVSAVNEIRPESVPLTLPHSEPPLAGNQAPQPQMLADLYDLKSTSNTAKFHFSRRDTLKGEKPNEILTRETVFKDAKDQVAVSELVTFKGSNEESGLDHYEVEQKQTQDSIKVSVKANEKKEPIYCVEVTDKKGTLKTENFRIQPDLLLPPFLVYEMQNHWENWLKSQVWEFRLLVPDLFQTVTFKVFVDTDSEKRKENVIRLKMKPANFAISAFVSPLYFEFNQKTKTLLRAEGRTLLLDENGDPFVARTEFKVP